MPPAFLSRLSACLTALVLLGSAALAACHSRETSAMNPAITPNGAVPSDVELMVFDGDGPVYGHRKPNPQHRYELNVTIADAPGPFSLARASVSLYAQNSACAIYHALPGASFEPHAFVPVPLERVSDSHYRATFATDPLINEAYWTGKPPCEWEFGSIRVFFQATGADGETGFNHSMDFKELALGKPVTRYFWKGGYPDDAHSNFADSGFSSPKKFKPELQGQLFSITLTAKQVTP